MAGGMVRCFDVMGFASQNGNLTTVSNGGGGSTEASARRRWQSLRGGRGMEGVPLERGQK